MKIARKVISFCLTATLIVFLSFPSISKASIINNFNVTENSKAQYTKKEIQTISLTTNDWISATSDYGLVKRNKNINDLDITLNGENNEVILHETGIGTNADSTVIYDLTAENFREFTFFETYVGVDANQTHSDTSVKFYVYLDNQIIFETETLKAKMPQQKIHVQLNNAVELKLVVVGQGDDNSINQANWGSPILGKESGSELIGESPNLKVQDYVYSYGETVNLHSLVTATDFEDGDLTNQVHVETNYSEGNYGKFPVTYKVSDSDGNMSSVRIEIYIPEPIEKFSNVQLQDLSNVLTTSSNIYSALQQIGFTDEQILRLSALPKKEDSFYETQPTKINDSYSKKDMSLKVNENLNGLSESDYIANRIGNVTSIANKTTTAPVGSDEFNKEVVYLYLSHYVDNPYYPNFSRAYSHIIVPEDREVYDSYIQVGTAMRNSHSLIQMINKGASIIQTSPSFINEIQQNERNIKDWATLINDTRSFYNDTQSVYEHANEFVDSFERNYKHAENTESLIRAINEDIADKDFEKTLYELYRDVVISAVLGNPVPTLILAGSSTYFEFVKNLADKAALAKVKYSTSMRITLRQYSTWG